MEELLDRSAVEMAELICCKEISSKELVEALLSRIENINPKINAIIQLDAERALKHSEELDRLLMKGLLLGPLHGVPFTVKDVYNTEGITTTLGTLGLQNYIPDHDASIITKLKNTGAILIGKTNVSELCTAAETDNLVYGETLNPYDFSRTPGGSSGGEGAIVAAGCSPFGIGSDLGGSLRIPAHYCGVTSLRPTVGRVALSKDLRGSNTFGIRTGSEALLAVDGPIARYVDDIFAIMKVISGPDGVDPNAIDLPLFDPLEIDLENLKIGYFLDNGVMSPQTDVSYAIKQSARALAEAGAEVTLKEPIFMRECLDVIIQLAVSGGIADAIEAVLLNYGTKQPSDLLLKFLDRIRRASHKHHNFYKAWDHWDYYRSKLTQYMHDFDAVICPVLPFTATLKNKSLWDDDLFPALSYCIGFSLMKLPILTVRVGEDQAQLPIGAQIVSKPWREDIVLAIGKFLEQKFGGWQPSGKLKK